MGAVALAPAASAAASGTTGPASCRGGEVSYTIKKSGKPYYSAIGDRVGAYNSSSSRATLKYDLAFSTVRQTSHTVSVGVSLEWEIRKILKIKVDGSYAYNVTKQTKKDNSVSFSLPVAGHYYGYVQPKVQYTPFSTTKWVEKPNCDVVKVKSNTVHAITAYPLFASCQSKNEACTPKPK
ncbi:hypothetical protein ABT075_38930 [Streptomyces sp. NPDC002677]|uniref:hypothetical protein n=1 Tax=Streptomyces sp. NPDC002677 TaxID=3154774 RepID=UPI00332CC6AC